MGKERGGLDVGFIVEGVRAGFSVIYCPLQCYLLTPGSWQASLPRLPSDLLRRSLITAVSGSPAPAGGLSAFPLHSSVFRL